MSPRADGTRVLCKKTLQSGAAVWHDVCSMRRTKECADDKYMGVPFSMCADARRV